MGGKILLVDDDRFVLNPLARLLGMNGYHCTTAVTAEEAWRNVCDSEFDLIVLDIGLPDMDGVSLCRRIRTKRTVPIMMLTARDEASDKIVGLEVGADDYVTKPFDPREILARVRAHLRRSSEYAATRQPDRRIVLGDLTLDLDAHDAFVDGREAGLTAREFDLVQLLADNPGRALSHDLLFERVWGCDAELGGKTLAVCVRRVRCKIEREPNRPTHLLTVRGYGYKLVAG